MSENKTFIGCVFVGYDQTAVNLANDVVVPALDLVYQRDQQHEEVVHLIDDGGEKLEIIEVIVHHINAAHDVDITLDLTEYEELMEV